ncbi:MAG: hypothetical protein V1835_00065 [Candidatus Micrarchaeota archaeon]
MDLTLRNVDDSLFRRFKAKCAEHNISLGGGFNQAAQNWIGGQALYKNEEKVQNKDLHMLTDLGSHIHDLHKAHEMQQKAKKRKGGGQ